MATLCENIKNLSSAASFEPIDPQECLKYRNPGPNTAYLWPVDENELTRLQKVFDEESIDLAGTWVTRPRENCPSCGKREEFMDHVYTAAKTGVHGVSFMKAFITHEIPAVGTGGGRHDLVCSHCDSIGGEPCEWDYNESYMDFHSDKK
ncbi:hypothetical protein BGZ99_005475 [Dissophora globulifera]|uniref:Uncharacterized protein n=1 Tax=Dissophora globulifera TaxID=979702 RepID=A0A9P6RJP2_9FUNG|nr:hypothetical protein BGZ99_005475 [Dissophora globulifera]